MLSYGYSVSVCIKLKTEIKTSINQIKSLIKHGLLIINEMLMCYWKCIQSLSKLDIKLKY